MAKVEIIHHYPTLEAVDAALVKHQDKTPRPYMGMSAIGHACTRKTWLDFRFASRQIFKAATLRKFEDGHRSEAVMADHLRLVKGIKLDTIRNDGKQHGFSDIGSHFRGHMDGAILGLIEAPKTWHVWEHKATDDKKKNVLEKLIGVDEKTALGKWDFIYFVQAQLYMHYSKMKRHFLTVSNGGVRNVISCRTDYEKEVAEKYIELARNLITSDALPPKISDDPTYFVCQHLCSHSDICHSTKAPVTTCRTCIHSSAVLDADGEGEWHCAWHKRVLRFSDQISACRMHLYHPELLKNWALPVEADVYHNKVQYTNQLNGAKFWNGSDPASYTSWEISACEDKAAIADSEIENVRQHFAGKIVG